MTQLWYILLGVVIGLVCMIPVVRMLLQRGERRARDAERRARDAERLAELGAMTGGLAHEIKNPLSTVGLNTQLLAESIRDSKLPEDDKQRMTRRLESLAREITRLGDILNDFLQFAGRIKLDPQPQDLGEIVEELADFFHPQCTQSGVTLRTQVGDGSGGGGASITANVDETLFKQALLNLMINAAQAMSAPPPSDGGGAARELILRVEQDDREARIHVTDTGPGIPQDRVDEIFHPYVSHRKGGTGLGLPTARRIIEEHGGRLEVQSEPGRGSDFVIHLPRN